MVHRTELFSTSQYPADAIEVYVGKRLLVQSSVLIFGQIVVIFVDPFVYFGFNKLSASKIAFAGSYFSTQATYFCVSMNKYFYKIAAA